MRATSQRTIHHAMRRLSGRWGSVLVIMGGYDDPGFGFASAVDAVMAEAARQGIPTVMWLTLRTADVSYVGPTLRLEHLHVPRQQPNPAAEVGAVRRPAADRRLGDVFGESTGLVLRRRHPHAAVRSCSSGLVHCVHGGASARWRLGHTTAGSTHALGVGAALRSWCFGCHRAASTDRRRLRILRGRQRDLRADD